ncbi:MAG: OsmC family peroxiredoxin, partial [Chryseobacterium sp.]|nr:OsmC family peroxiredoxin [Chryseobacterium sp.]
MKRSAKAVWKGTVKDGNGVLTTQSTTLNDTQYSFKSRFEESVGTNPEELLAAAHAGCFTMKTSALLTEAGYIPETLETDCKI